MKNLFLDNGHFCLFGFGFGAWETLRVAADFPKRLAPEHPIFPSFRHPVAPMNWPGDRMRLEWMRDEIGFQRVLIDDQDLLQVTHG